MFVSWVHGSQLVNFYNRSDRVILDAFTGNAEWNLPKTTIFSRFLTFDFTNDVFPAIGFTLTLKRMPAYYVYNIIAPVMLLTLMSCLVYVMPAEAGEKAGLQITLGLSFSVMLLIMGESTPKSGKTTPLMGMYVMTSWYRHIFFRIIDPICSRNLPNCHKWGAFILLSS